MDFLSPRKRVVSGKALLSEGQRSMGDVIPFKRTPPSDKFKHRGLCRSGFHKWEVLTERRFDVKQGKLLTASRCARCGATKTEGKYPRGSHRPHRKRQRLAGEL